jgi:hypothetical protein
VYVRRMDAALSNGSPQSGAPRAEAGLVSGARLAAHLDCSRAYIQELESAGVLRRGEGGFDLDAARVAYIRHLRQARRHSPRSAAATKVAELKAKKLQHEIAAYEGAHMMTDEALEFIEKLVGGVLLVELGNLPALIARRDLELRRRIEAAVYTIREKIAAAAEEFARGKQPS